MFVEKKDAQLKTLVVPKVETSCPSKCYVCDQNVSTLDGTLLLNAMLPFSNLSVPQKIVKLVGSDCMVLVYETDLLCIRCTNLFFELDRLEMEADKITEEIVSHLTMKYDMNSNSVECALPLQGLKRKLNIEDTNKDSFRQEEVEKKLSEMFGSPVMITSVDTSTKYLKAGDKSAKSKNTQPYRCPICREGFNEQKRLRQHVVENHLSKYKCNKCQTTFKDETLLKKHLARANCEETKSKNGSNVDVQKKFKCAICSQKFETKEYLNTHLRKHKAVFFKCGSCGETFQKRDILMKHLELHVKGSEDKAAIEETNDTQLESISQVENSNNKDSSMKPKVKEIKFLDCKSCSLSYIDSEHYSLHLNTSHRKANKDLSINKTVKEEKVENSDNIDLETIFEKLHSDTTEVKSTDANHINDEAVEQLVQTQGDGIDLLTENFVDDVNITSTVVKKVDHPKQNSIVTSNKVYLYKCPGCSSLYDNSNDLQLHILTAGHVEYNSEIQILEVDSSDTFIHDTNSKMTASNNAINLLSFSSKDSDDVHTQIQTQSNSNGNATNKIQFLTSDNTNEIKLITFHDDSNIKMVDLQNSTEIVTNSEMYSNDITLNSNRNSNKEIQELLESVVDSTPLTVPTVTTVNPGTIERSKIQIIDEKTIDISQLVTATKDDLASQEFQLNDLCNLTVKSENHVTNQVSSDDMYLISTDLLNANLNTDITSLMTITKGGTTTVPMKKIIKCGKCNFKCTDRSVIKLHMAKHMTNESPQSLLVNNLPIILDNLQTPNVTIIGTTTNLSNTVNITPEELNNSNLECKLCNETFKTDKLLNRHNRQFHRKLICTYCNKHMRNSRSLRLHEERHLRAGDVCICTDCGKEFKTKWGLYNHQPVHTGNYKLFCEFCNRGFMSKVLLEEHRGKHTKEERCVCDICGKKFQFKSTYWIHRKWHDNPFPYKCNFCNRKFRHTSLLAIHRRKHTGERPYKCPYCRQTFLVSGTLKRHLILHTGVYPFICEHCEHGFTTKHKLAVHLAKIHGDSKLLNQKTIKPDNYKMVVKDNINECDNEMNGNDLKLEWTNNNEQNGRHDSTPSILLDNTSNTNNLFNNFCNNDV